ncbi:MAG: hypothetical protein EBV68_06580, partial [Betaproteobacteria bacterium]|nr:hypothetical protein [Betaproteobacteria bacterium]
MKHEIQSKGAYPRALRLGTGSPWRVFAMVAVAVFLVALDSTIVLAAFPALRDAYAGVSAA